MSDWKHGICDSCLSDPACCCSCCCHCIQTGRNMENAGLGSCFAWGVFDCFLFPCAHTMSRNAIRTKYNIEGNIGFDILCTIFCGCCALIQEAREIREHGDEKK